MAKPSKRGKTEERGTAAAPQSAGDATVAAPDRERIAMRAYELYLARGGAGGDAMEDWLAAEREVSSTRRDREPE
ncbi:MAG TPA: DUF2934 domain-containing protein [Vicinamibacterales bacterium]|nr:DUF2934 domain-containing protein [Vicinamibacterales bacterium]